jgi:PAS domain S-box-containing protein
MRGRSLMSENGNHRIGTSASVSPRILELQKTVLELERRSRFFEMLIRSLPGVFYAFDQDQQFLNCNENMEKITGYCRDELLHMTVNELFFAADLKRIKKAVRTVFSKGEVTVEAELTNKRGERIPYLFSAVSTRIENAMYVLGMGIDLTELKQTQDALRESEIFYRVLAERMTVGAMLCQNSKIVFANEALLLMFGYTEAGQFFGKDIGELVSREFEMYFREMFEVLERRFSEQRSFETRCMTKAGREIWIQGRASLIQWKGLPTVFMTARDITDSKERELSMLDEAEHLRRENISLRSSIKDRYRLGNIIGKSPAMQEVYELILNAAATNASVIVYGESGTGKELVAKAIHDMSSRSEREFVPVNCAAVPENLMESEFFGHKKGAFTGAHADKQGYLDLADGGTLFLDEVGELGLNLQAKLLRAIEGGGYSPVGSSVNKLSDFRIIAATNRNLLDQVRKRAIREDFFYRIHVIPINVPPLRNRKEDIPLLVEHFLRLYSQNGDPSPLPGQVLEGLMSYDWPGNVRELQNAIQRYIAVKRLEFIPSSPSARDGPGVPETHLRVETHGTVRLTRNVEEAERISIRKALELCKGRKGRAAKALGISRKTLFRKMKRLEIS